MSSIFICHSSIDKPFVRMLKNRLERFEIRVWVDEDEIKPGASLIGTISAAIEEMEFLGVVLSPSSVRSKWVKEELELALNNQIQQAEVRVIPILLRKSAIPGFLKGKKYVDFSPWSRNKTRKNSHEILNHAIKEVVKGVGVDPSDSERWSGRKMIKVCDFRRRIADHFAPSVITIEFFDDESGLNFIKVDNDDSTFQLYEYWSKPSHLDVINEVFRKLGEPLITDLVIPEATIFWTDKERDETIAAIIDRHGLSIEELWKSYEPGHESHDKWKAARDEYDRWFFEQKAISLVREGDFGSRRT